MLQCQHRLVLSEEQSVTASMGQKLNYRIALALVGFEHERQIGEVLCVV